MFAAVLYFIIPSAFDCSCNNGINFLPTSHTHAQTHTHKCTHAHTVVQSTEAAVPTSTTPGDEVSKSVASTPKQEEAAPTQSTAGSTPAHVAHVAHVGGGGVAGAAGGGGPKKVGRNTRGNRVLGITGECSVFVVFVGKGDGSNRISKWLSFRVCMHANVCASVAGQLVSVCL